MHTFSVAEAKAHFAELVQQAEMGQALRITRRGKPVAVVLSDAQYQRLSAAAGPRQSLFDFTTKLRLEAAAKGISMFTDADLEGLRNQSERATPMDLE